MNKDPEEYSDDGAELSGTDDDDSASVNSQIEDDDDAVDEIETKEKVFTIKTPSFSPPSDDEGDEALVAKEDEDDDDDEEGDSGDEEVVEEIKKQPNNSVNQNNLIVQNEDDEIDQDDADDDEEDLDEHYLQKFNEEVNKNYILDFHPECKIHNYDEISALTTVIRDNHNNIIDDLHRTIPYLTKYEKARVLGQRAKQINTGAKAFVKVPDNVVDGYLVAELELVQKRVPFIIRRPIFGGGCEYWNLKDLEIIGF
jgi:DNA-directed RNA polymerase I, II, and III subunit RPABC2